MNETNDMESLGSVWRASSPALPVDLQRLVRKQSLRMRLHATLEVVLSVVFLGGTLWLAIVRSTTEFSVLAVGVWIITLVTLAYSIANRAGTWNSAADDTRAYLAISLRRCRAGLAAIRYGLYLVAVETMLLAAWHAWYWSSRRPAPTFEVWLLAACLPAAFLVALLALRARKQHELARLEALERELAG